MSKNSKNSKPKGKDSRSETNTDDYVPHIYEIEVRNRVVKKGSGKRIKGVQGMWYEEVIYWVTDDEDKLPEYVKHHIRSRRILGKPLYRLDKFIRQVEILKIRRII